MSRHTDALCDNAQAFMPYPSSPVAHAATGPLSGLSFAAKDIYHVKGYPTSGGQPMLMALWGVQDRTAPVVQSLLDAGARFVGKTVTDELAFSMNGQNAHYGAPINVGLGVCCIQPLVRLCFGLRHRRLGTCPRQPLRFGGHAAQPGTHQFARHHGLVAQPGHLWLVRP